MIKYFVSYSWSIDSKSGFGNIIIEINRKIINRNQLDELSHLIKKNNTVVKIDHIVILNFIELKD